MGEYTLLREKKKRLAQTDKCNDGLQSIGIYRKENFPRIISCWRLISSQRTKICTLNSTESVWDSPHLLPNERNLRDAASEPDASSGVYEFHYQRLWLLKKSLFSCGCLHYKASLRQGASRAWFWSLLRTVRFLEQYLQKHVSTEPFQNLLLSTGERTLKMKQQMIDIWIPCLFPGQSSTGKASKGQHAVCSSPLLVSSVYVSQDSSCLRCPTRDVSEWESSCWDVTG